MFHPVTARTLAIAACGWLLAWDAAALTLGRAHGAPLIGRPLELSIPVTLEAPDAEGPCASADLFYGESRVGRAPSVRWEPGSGNQGVLHVDSPQAVDEPMVTLYLRVGCGQSTTRRFVLLAEPPPANEASVAVPRSLPVQPPVAATAPSAQPAAPSAPAATATSPRRRETVAQATPGLRAAPELTSPQAAARPVRPAPPQRAKKPEAGTAASRLKLEPLDLSIDRDPTLRLSSELRSQVATSPQQRAEAAAMWAALQKSPDETLQESVRLKGVERDLASLRESTRQNASAVGQMRAQVEQARDGRNTAALLVLVLSAVLAGLLGWLGWRWYRVYQLERVGRWFERHGETAQGTLGGSAVDVDVDVDVGPTTSPQPFAPAVPAAAAQAATAGASASAAAGGPISTWGSGEFQPSRGGTLRMVGVAELIDVHDKADFFLSIGETEQAVSLLEAHVHDQVETSALAWMDLLELYHSLGKRLEYERLRNEFRQRFTAQVPDFEHFDQPTASLENYSRALSRIVALWPSQRVLDVIEESIFRKPGLPGADPFSLEAYRELVLLYHVAKEMAPQEAPAQPGAARANFGDTALQPLNVLDAPDSAIDTRPITDNDVLLVPPASSRIGVDIDLTAMGWDAGATREEHEVSFDLSPIESAVDTSPHESTQAAQPHPGRELPALDFDVSAFDEPAPPLRKHGS